MAQEVTDRVMKVIQPKFSKLLRNFAGVDSLFISEAASGRPGNERAVKIVKRSHFISSGMCLNQFFKRMSSTWKSFAFQSIVMCKLDL